MAFVFLKNSKIKIVSQILLKICQNLPETFRNRFQSFAGGVVLQDFEFSVVNGRHFDILKSEVFDYLRTPLLEIFLREPPLETSEINLNSPKTDSEKLWGQ